MGKKLGRGLGALLEAKNGEVPATNNRVSVDLLEPNLGQPRKVFEQTKLHELSASIRSHGVLQPIVVRKKDDGKYEIIAGERRWRAAKMADLDHVPIHVVDCKDDDILALSLIENIQRADLNPIEEAAALQTLVTDCACTQEELGIILGKSRSYVGNAMRLLYLPDGVRRLVSTGLLSAGHARCLLGADNAEEMAHMAIKRAMSVRQLENMLKLNGGKAKSTKAEDGGTRIEKHVDYESGEIACRIAESLRVDVKLKITRRGGVFTLVCRSCEELERLIDRLTSLGKERG